MKVKLLPEFKMLQADKKTLRMKLDAFYESTSDYMAFEDTSNQVDSWLHIGNEIKRRLKAAPFKHIRILEVGAGRSGFGQWLDSIGLREKAIWSAQDVTRKNAEWLTAQSDFFFYGDVDTITGNDQYDIIFSTYVLEHVTDPFSHLENLYRLIKPDGSIFIFCPRYDVPGYLCPSSRHFNFLNRLAIQFEWIKARYQTLLKNRPAFLIQTDLAVFYKPFFPDADAVHWVSELDLKLWANEKKGRFNKLKERKIRIASKGWVVQKFLTCRIQINFEPNL